MPVIGPRIEIAHDEMTGIENQMHRRRQVDAANFGMEALDVEGEGIQETIPAYNIKGVMRYYVLEIPFPAFDDYSEISLLLQHWRQMIL